ncbi:hypothetical protein DIPPA_26892 [Diplonema papillatum]|nr:hypothetical protein DIPPA_26892 [Diplonema papillatum]
MRFYWSTPTKTRWDKISCSRFGAGEAVRTGRFRLRRCVGPVRGQDPRRLRDFLVADVSSTGKDDVEFVRWLAKEKGVAGVPLRMFFSPTPSGVLAPRSHVRFAICKDPAYIDQAVANITRTRT